MSNRAKFAAIWGSVALLLFGGYHFSRSSAQQETTTAPFSGSAQEMLGTPEGRMEIRNKLTDLCEGLSKAPEMNIVCKADFEKGEFHFVAQPETFDRDLFVLAGALFCSVAKPEATIYFGYFGAPLQKYECFQGSASGV